MDRLKKTIQSLSFALYDTGETILSALVFSLAFPLYISNYLDIKIFSLIYGFTFVISFIFSLYIGKYADERGNRKELFVLFGFLTFLTTALIFFTYKHYILALIFFLLSAIFHQQAIVFYNSLLLNFKDRGFISGLGVSFGYIGSAITLIYFAEKISIPQVFLIASIVFLILALPSFIFLSNPNVKREKINLKEIFKDKKFIYVMLSILALTEVANTIISMMGIYLKFEFDLKQIEIYKIVGYSAIGGIIGGIFWGLVLKKISVNKVFPMGFFMWMFVIISSYFLNKDWLIALGIIVGFSLAHLWSTSRVYLLENFPKEEVSVRLSFLSLSERIATSVGLFAWSGFLFLTNDYRLSFLLMIIFPLIALFAFLKSKKINS